MAPLLVGDPESSVNRIYFQLLVHRVCRNYAKKCYIFAYPDQGKDSGNLRKFHGHINLTAQRRYGVEHRLAEIEQADSSRCNLIQMVDIIIGGIAHLRNFPAGHETGANHKFELAKYILERSKHPDWKRDTARHARRFTVWNFRHQKLVAGDKAPQSARRYIRQG